MSTASPPDINPTSFIPFELAQAGWTLERQGRDPLLWCARNVGAGLSTEPFERINDVIESARVMAIEHAESMATEAAERAAIQDEAAGSSSDVIEEEEVKASPAAAPAEIAEDFPDELPPGFFSEPQLVPVAALRTDGGTQPREALDMFTVNEYKEAMQAGDVFPPVDAFYDGTDTWLADGFHRARATIEAEIDEILTKVHKGTQRDALFFSLGANATHGLPRSREDKRRAVLVLLGDPDWCAWSDREIAKHANVSHTFVAHVRRELHGEDEPAGVTGEAPGNVATEAEIDRQSPLIEPRSCRVCGCTEAKPCEGGCSWVSSDLCSNCPAPVSADDGAQKDDVITQANEADWQPAELVAVMNRHTGVLYRGQLEDMGCTYGAILHALNEGVIVQPETGKFTLPDHKPQPSAEPAKEKKQRTEAASSPAPRPKPAIEEMLNGRKLSVSFVFGIAPGKVSLSINTDLKNPNGAVRKLIDIESARGFSGDVMELIKSALDNPIAAPAPAAKVVKKAATKKPAKPPAKKAAKAKPVAKKKAARKTTRRR